MVDGYIKRQEKHDKSTSAPVPQYLLCNDCHDKHSKGSDITLSDGSTKRHFQKKDAASEEARKAKNKEKNEKKKARKAAAKKEAEEAAEAEPARYRCSK